jgi:hypothetical protein
MSVLAYLWDWIIYLFTQQPLRTFLGIIFVLLGICLRYLRVVRLFRKVFPPQDKFDPTIPNHTCLGRKNERESIHRHFFPVHPDDPAAAREARPRGTLRPFVIHAYGGFGKTTLAYHYANEYRAFFNQVWRISAESPEVCRYQWEEVRPFFTNRPRLLNLFTYWPSPPKLVIFDNVSPKSETYLKEEIKALPRDVRVLMTARRPVQGAHPLNLEGLRPEVAVELLRSKAELGTSSAEIDADEPGKRLARDLGYHPLSLVLAGETCHRNTISFSKYSADIGHHLNEAPAEAEYGKTIHLVVRQSLAQVAANPSAAELAESLPYCAADRIPKSLYSQALSRPETAGDAFDQLWSVALVDHAKEFSTEDTAATMHRVIQAVIRDQIKREKPQRGVEVISKLLAFLSKQLLGEKTRSKDLDFPKYLPQFLQLLQYLDDPAYRTSNSGDPLDTTVKNLVAGITRLVETAPPALIQTTYLPGLHKLVARYYEVDDLSDLLKPLLARITVPSDQWAEFREGCLAADNYVLRYSLGDALGKRALADKTPHTLDEIRRLIRESDDLNHFELGGYALKTYYSNITPHDPLSRLIERFLPSIRRRREDQFDKALLVRLAEHHCYPGRSILGDLMLNLVYQRRTPSHLLPPQGKNRRFWRPIWDFVRYDVQAIHAAEHVYAGVPLPPEAEGERDYRNQLVAWQKDLLKRLRGFPVVRGIVRNYFTIGADTTRITGDTAATDFAKLASADMRRQDPTLFSDVLRLLYGHPLWSVAESAASVAETLVTHAPPNSTDRQAYIDIVQSLFHASLPWRVRYGATETAYQIRDSEDPNMATFGRAVKLFYGDEVSKLRGLCAENLFSVMLNASDDDRVSLEREFDTPIREWLKDKDCWVLDHVHRYFHTLHLRGVNVSHFTSGPPSPLFEKSPDWWTEPRDQFLSAIEDAKESRPA